MIETICDVYWEGPCAWKDLQACAKPGHVLYSLHGTHPLYGRDMLLYIGKTDVGLDIRLSQHAWWVEEELDAMMIKFASIREYGSIEEWWQVYDTLKEDDVYPKADASIVHEVEALLIYAHQPAFNSSGKVNLNVRKGLRIFNTGKVGLLHPELSWAYYGE